MKQNDRIRAYARQQGIDTTGLFKNNTTKNRLLSRLTPAQQKRVRLKSNA